MGGIGKSSTPNGISIATGVLNSGGTGNVGPVTTPKTTMANAMLILRENLSKVVQALGSDSSKKLLETVDGLLSKGTVPRNSQGAVADVIWRTLPSGSTVIVSDATNSADNGLWISGKSTTGSGGVWTHLEDANGNPINASNMPGTVINRGTDSFGLFNINNKAKLRIKDFKP